MEAKRYLEILIVMILVAFAVLVLGPERYILVLYTGVYLIFTYFFVYLGTILADMDYDRIKERERSFKSSYDERDKVYLKKNLGEKLGGDVYNYVYKEAKEDVKFKLSPRELPVFLKVLLATISIFIVNFSLSIIELPTLVFILLFMVADMIIFSFNFQSKYSHNTKMKYRMRFLRAKTHKEKLESYIATLRFSPLRKPFFMTATHIMGLFIIGIFAYVTGISYGELFWNFLGLGN